MHSSSQCVCKESHISWPYLMAMTTSLGQGHLGKATFIQQFFKDCSRDISGLHFHNTKLLNKDRSWKNYKENSGENKHLSSWFFLQNNLNNVFIRKKNWEEKKKMEVIQ